MPDGTLAPSMVSQNTTVSITSIMGKPSQRLVTNPSMLRSRSKRGLSPLAVTARSVIRWLSDRPTFG